jgi:tetratricopeptide (TPR) repeat protein
MKTNRSDDAIAFLTKCRDMMKRGYETAPSLPDLIGWADALYMLGGAYERIEAYEASFKLYEEAMALYICAEKDYKSDTRRETANCLINIGGVFELKKEYDRALENYNKALEINRRLAVRDGDELSLKHLMASCTHTAELCETMGQLVEALALFREKADVGIRLSKLKPAVEPPEILFLTPSENFAERLEQLESKLPWYSLLFEMEEHPSQDKMYITYFTMGRLTEELARKTNNLCLWQEALRLFEASENILRTIYAEFSDNELEKKLREVKSCAKRIKNQINQGGNSNE